MTIGNPLQSELRPARMAVMFAGVNGWSDREVALAAPGSASASATSTCPSMLKRKGSALRREPQVHRQGKAIIACVFHCVATEHVTSAMQYIQRSRVSASLELVTKIPPSRFRWQRWPSDPQKLRSKRRVSAMVWEDQVFETRSSSAMVERFGSAESGFVVAADTCAANPAPSAGSRRLVGLRPLWQAAPPLSLRLMVYRLPVPRLRRRERRRELPFEELYRLEVALLPRPAQRPQSRAAGLALLLRQQS